MRAALKGLALLLLCLAAYAPAFKAGFIWDDDLYLAQNRALEGPGALRRVWASSRNPQYYPAVFTSFWLEKKLWGSSPSGYHGVNVALHAANALLAWKVLLALGLPGAWFAAALFAVHPVHVESVAWISERKNLLSAFFCLLTLLLYFRRLGWLPGRSPRRAYWAALGCFLLALLSKTVACTLPVSLLLLQAWRSPGEFRSARDWARRALPLLPFLVLGAGFGLLTVWYERRFVGALGEPWDLDFARRLILAGRVPWFYLGKLLWPEPLSFVYPRWTLDPSRLLSWAPLAALLASLAALAYLARRPEAPARAVLPALLLFLATLFPALGFFNVYPFRYSYVADHFQYLASLAPLALLASFRARWRRPARAAGLLFLLALAFHANRRCLAFRDLESLWKDTLDKNPKAWLAHNNLGTLLIERGEVGAGLLHLEEARALYPGGAEIWSNQGSALIRLGRHAEALGLFRRAVELKPRYAPARLNLGLALEALGRQEEAAASYREAAALDPADAQARNNLGLLLLRLGRSPEALPPLREATRLAPGFARAWNNLGIALAVSGDREAAEAAFRRALSLEPGLAEAEGNLRKLWSFKR